MAELPNNEDPYTTWRGPDALQEPSPDVIKVEPTPPHDAPETIGARETDAEREASAELNKAFDEGKAAAERKRYKQDESGLYEAWTSRVDQETAHLSYGTEPKAETPTREAKKPNRFLQGSKGFFSFIAKLFGITALFAMKELFKQGKDWVKSSIRRTPSAPAATSSHK